MRVCVLMDVTFSISGFFFVKAITMLLQHVHIRMHALHVPASILTQKVSRFAKARIIGTLAGHMRVHIFVHCAISEC